MTRAANGAQRSGAAALIIILTQRDEHYAHVCDYFASSFFVAETPARLLQQGLWAGEGWPGSTVLHGSGGRTTKPLICLGSTVPFCSPSRDACADVCGCTRVEGVQNRRTVELEGNIEVFHQLTGSSPVLCERSSRTGMVSDAGKPSNVSGLPGSTSNKIGGGYRFTAFADLREPDQRLFTASARRKFRRWTRRAAGASAPIGAAGAIVQVSGAVVQVSGADRAISVTYAGAQRAVGTPMLERGDNAVSFQAVAGGRIQPAGLDRRAVEGAPLAGLRHEGGTPPIAARPFTSSLAQPIFGRSADLRIRCCDRLIRQPRLPSRPNNGSGCSNLVSGSCVDRGHTLACEARVGEQQEILGGGRSRETATVWGGATRVN
jgi:hypothetical protein